MSTTRDDHALILRRVDYGEADVILDLLTQESGRVGVYARGARKSTRRFAGGLEAFALLRVRYRPGREDALGSLQDTENYEFFGRIVEDPLRLAAAAYLLTLVELSVQKEQGADPFFTYVLTIFRWLNRAQLSPVALACGMLRAEIVLLQDAGLLASLACCQVTGVPLSSLDAAIFRPGEGLVSVDASRLGDNGIRLERAAVHLLESVLERRVVETLDAEAFHALRRALFLTWMTTLDREPRTWRAYDDVLRHTFA